MVCNEPKQSGQARKNAHGVILKHFGSFINTETAACQAVASMSCRLSKLLSGRVSRWLPFNPRLDAGGSPASRMLTGRSTCAVDDRPRDGPKRPLDQRRSFPTLRTCSCTGENLFAALCQHYGVSNLGRSGEASRLAQIKGYVARAAARR